MKKTAEQTLWKMPHAKALLNRRQSEEIETRCRERAAARRMYLKSLAASDSDLSIRTLPGEALPNHAMPDYALGRKRSGPANIVYVFSADAWCPVSSGVRQIVKIGITNDPMRRAREICTHSPVECVLALTAEAQSEPHARYVEMMLHREYQDARSHGEWFFAATEEVTASVMERIAAPWIDPVTIAPPRKKEEMIEVLTCDGKIVRVQLHQRREGYASFCVGRRAYVMDFSGGVFSRGASAGYRAEDGRVILTPRV